MGFLTGEQAAIDGFDCLRRWNVVTLGDPDEGYCSQINGGPIVTPGNYDWTGVAEAYGGQPQKLPGGTFTFTGSARNGTGFQGPAIVDRIRVVWDVEKAKRLHHWVWFSGTGQGQDGAYSATDSGSPSPISAAGLAVKLGAAELPIRRGVLDIECMNAAYNDSSTDGYTGRAEGNYRARFQLEIYFSDFRDLPLEQSYATMLWQTVKDSDTGWKVDYGFMDRVTRIIDTEGEDDGRAKGNAAQIVGRWAAYTGTQLGTIVAPDSTVIWSNV